MLRRIEEAEKAVRVFVPSTAAVRCRVRAQGVVIEVEEDVLERLSPDVRAWVAAEIAKLFGGRKPTFAPYKMGSAFLGKDVSR